LEKKREGFGKMIVAQDGDAKGTRKKEKHYVKKRRDNE